jgi:polyribonucleotide nucleotidyltransferase
MFNILEKKIKIGNHEVILESGRIARQAGGSVLLTCEGTQILVTATAKKEAAPEAAFFPLSVDYVEKYYAAGRIPGGYLKRESRPSDREVLISRLIDRPIRPLFPETYMAETQVVATVLSFDPKCPTEFLAILGASASLCLSSIPFPKPVGGIRIGYIDGHFVINPTDEEIATSELDLVVAGTKDAILMVEAGARFLTEEKMLEALTLAQEEIKKICLFQEDIVKQIGKEKIEISLNFPENKALEAQLEKKFRKKIEKALSIVSKAERNTFLQSLRTEIKEAFQEEFPDQADQKILKQLVELKIYQVMRQNVLKKDERIDGRKTTQIRPIDCEVGILKRTHGSALFTRGETQSIGIVTLGTSEDAQRYESLLNSVNEKPFMLHYNMPGYSVGEVKRLGSPGRREVGHGALAERALKAALPPLEKFPYTIRMVSEITESNGSSSMATVCSGTLSMLNAGIPLAEPIAGIAMGLIYENPQQYAVLSDILGDEDHLGDMDFKVAGGRHGITALQMDIKISGVSLEILKKALEQARVGRLHILEKMLHAINKPSHLSTLAPRIEKIKIKPEKIRDLIGVGGKNIKKIVSESKCKVEVDDNGIVSLASTNGEAAQKAKRMIHYLTSDPEIGQIYLGVVKKITDFGIFVEIKPDVEGLVHMSHLAHHRVEKAEDVVKENDEVLVKVIELDRTGRIKLSRKDAIGASPKGGAVSSLKEWLGN